MPRYEAFINREFKDRGMATVVITRTDDSGYLQAGVVLLDTYCLGAKDAFVSEMVASEWPHEVDRFIPAEERMPIHPACARKLIEGGVAYAESLGFSPHRDYRKARRVFGSVDAKSCPENFVYGKDGKPLYIAGPDDDEEKTNRIINVLRAKLGPDGFHYLYAVDVDTDAEEAEAARERLIEFFSGNHSALMNFEMVSSLLTALEIRPVELSNRALLNMIWGGATPQGMAVEEVREIEAAILVYRADLADALKTAAETDQPMLAVDFFEDLPEKPSAEDAVRQYDIATTWCCGFLRAAVLWPSAWTPPMSRSDLQPHFDALRQYAKPSFLAKIRFASLPADGHAKRVGAAVLALYCALRPPPNPPAS